MGGLCSVPKIPTVWGSLSPWWKCVIWALQQLNLPAHPPPLLPPTPGHPGLAQGTSCGSWGDKTLGCKASEGPVLTGDRELGGPCISPGHFWGAAPLSTPLAVPELSQQCRTAVSSARWAQHTPSPLSGIRNVLSVNYPCVNYSYGSVREGGLLGVKCERFKASFSGEFLLDLGRSGVWGIWVSPAAFPPLPRLSCLPALPSSASDLAQAPSSVPSMGNSPTGRTRCSKNSRARGTGSEITSTSTGKKTFWWWKCPSNLP